MGGVLLRIEHRKGCWDSNWGEMFLKNPRFEYSLAELNQSIKLFLAMFDKPQLVAKEMIFRPFFLGKLTSLLSKSKLSFSLGFLLPLGLSARPLLEHLELKNQQAEAYRTQKKVD